MPNAIKNAPKRCKDKHVGTVTGYRHHMEKRRKDKRHKICLACREAMRVQSADYRKRRILNGARSVQRVDNARWYKLMGGHLLIDAAGTRRRLQALNAIGWSLPDLGSRIGVHGNGLGFIIRRRKWVTPETADKIKALYDELEMIPAPSDNHMVYGKGNPVSTVKSRARSKGWVPPLGWEEIDDPFALPIGLSPLHAYNWFWNTATESEKIEWVLEHGLSSVTMK